MNPRNHNFLNMVADKIENPKMEEGKTGNQAKYFDKTCIFKHKNYNKG